MGIQINGNTNNINAGIGSLSIEDINELDIVGVATAANFKTGVSNLHDVGLTLSGGQIDVGSNIKIGNAGVITATSFVGSGANLTGISGGISNIVEDTSPQLGGDLQSNGNDIDFADNDKAIFGAGSDLQIFHESSSNDNIIDCATTRPLRIRFGGSNQFEFLSGGGIKMNDGRKIVLGDSTDFTLFHNAVGNIIDCRNAKSFFVVNDTGGGNDTMIKAVPNGGVDLYHNGIKQCETSANGLAFPSGKGIDFSADGSGTLKTLPNSFNAEVLHDYEVGTFVPNISYDTGTNQYYGSPGSGQNVASSKGEYIRIGDLVSFAGEITLTGNRSSTQNVHISIGGLPYNGLHSSQQSSLMTGWGGAAWPKNDSNPSYRLIYAWHAYTTLNFYFYQAAGNNGIDGFRFHGYYRCAP